MHLSELGVSPHSAQTAEPVSAVSREASSFNPLSLPNLITQIHGIESQMSHLSGIGLSPRERARAKKGLIEDKARRVFLLLGERDNPGYKLRVTLFRQNEDEIHERSAHKFEIEVKDAVDAPVGKVKASIATLARIPYFQHDSRRVLYEVVRPDAVEPEKPSTFATRTHDEIRSIEKDFAVARRDGNEETMNSLSRDRDKIIKKALKLRVDIPELRHFIRVVLRAGLNEPLVNLQYLRADDINPFNNYTTMAWNRDIDALVRMAGGYNWIDPRLDSGAPPLKGLRPESSVA